MARALKNPDIDPTYLEFFGMTRSPFAPLSTPSQIFHSEQYSLLTAHLASATKQADHLMVICGADGSGKTTLLNRYITSLTDETSFATFDETCADGTDFYCAFLRQLGFHDITGTQHELRRITKEFLIHRGKAQDPVLLILDNAHLVSPTVLEQLRWIAETKVDDRRVLSIVLAGNSDLLRIMHSPAMKLMTFRNHVEFFIRVFTEEETEDYVRHRLRLAGGVDAAKFSSEAHPLIYRFSGGIPDVINMLSNEVLAEACTRETRVISADLIRTVADKNRLEPTAIKYEGKGRRKSDPEFMLATTEQKKEERITARAAPGTLSGSSSDPDADSNAADVSVLKGHIARMQAQMLALKAENQQSQLDIGAYTRDIEGLHKQLADKTRDNEKLQTAVSESGELRKQLEEKAQQIQVLGEAAAEIDDLRKALDQKTHDAEKGTEAAALIDDLRDQLDAKTRQAEQLGKTVAQMNDLRKQLDTQTRENKSLKAAVSDKDGLEKQLKAKTREIARLDKAVSEMDDLKRQLEARSEDANKLSSSESELAELRAQLETKINENQALSDTIDENIDKIRALEKSVSDGASALKESDKAAKTLVRDLKKEQSATRRAQASEERVKTRLEKLTSTKQEMQKTVRQLTADLKRANKQPTYDQERDKDVRALTKELKEKTELVEFGDELVAKLENSLQESKDECESLRADAKTRDDLQEVIAEKEARITTLESELASYSHMYTATQPALSGQYLDADDEDSDSADVHAEPTISRIEILKGKTVESVVKLSDLPARIMIGRGDDCELHLNSKFVSRHHALIFCEGSAIYIEDLNSFNGTVVNYKKILRSELHPDDKIVVGDYELRPF